MNKKTQVIIALCLSLFVHIGFCEDENPSTPSSLSEIELEDLELFAIASGVLMAHANDIEDVNAPWTVFLMNSTEQVDFEKSMDIFRPYIMQMESLLRQQGALDKAQLFKVSWLAGTNIYEAEVQKSTTNDPPSCGESLNELVFGACMMADGFIKEFGPLVEAARVSERKKIKKD